MDGMAKSSLTNIAICVPTYDNPACAPTHHRPETIPRPSYDLDKSLPSQCVRRSMYECETGAFQTARLSKLQEVHVEETSRLEQDQSALNAGSAEQCQRSFKPSGVVTCINLETSISYMNTIASTYLTLSSTHPLDQNSQCSDISILYKGKFSICMKGTLP